MSTTTEENEPYVWYLEKKFYVQKSRRGCHSFGDTTGGRIRGLARQVAFIEFLFPASCNYTLAFNVQQDCRQNCILCDSPHPKPDSTLCQDSSYRIPQLCPGHTVPRLHYTSSPYNTKWRGEEVGGGAFKYFTKYYLPSERNRRMTELCLEYVEILGLLPRL
jgi:hypothetical protein